jgi:hypothetical protein
VRAANYYFQNNGLVSNMATLYVDFQVRQRLHRLLVKMADSVLAFIVLVPGRIIVPRRSPEGAESTFKIVRVLESNVLLNHRDAARFLSLRFDALVTSTFRQPSKCGAQAGNTTISTEMHVFSLVVLYKCCLEFTCSCHLLAKEHRIEPTVVFL